MSVENRFRGIFISHECTAGRDCAVSHDDIQALK